MVRVGFTECLLQTVYSVVFDRTPIVHPARTPSGEAASLLPASGRVADSAQSLCIRAAGNPAAGFNATTSRRPASRRTRQSKTSPTSCQRKVAAHDQRCIA